MQEQPDVLLISTDHWPASLLGCAGHPTILTPTLDQLAASGRRFTNCYSECPVCIPARRTLMTGLSARTHGDRVYRDRLEMPDPAHYPTLAQTFRNHGYQAVAVGKMHVYPQRNRIGFDDVILSEEGRVQFGVVDDYELFLGDRGYPGAYMAHGMGNNNYETRPWHLPDDTHVTEWATRQMARQIARRDPTRPAFWYLSYVHPHPPLTPLQTFLDMYDPSSIDEPESGHWSRDPERTPYPIWLRQQRSRHIDPRLTRCARRAFYALCTHIDYQLRIILGTLREHGRLQNTIIAFTSDHGDMLGNHGLWAKRFMYEDSAGVPLILLGAEGNGGHERVGCGAVDDQLVGWQDIMPTLLDLAGLPVPASCEGQSAVGEQRRQHLYGEIDEAAAASRMIRDQRYKLIYYPMGNRLQLFDIEADPREFHDLSESPEHAEIRDQLSSLLIEQLYGDDLDWVEDGRLVGLPEPERSVPRRDRRALDGQRGLHWPPPPGQR